MSRPSRDALLMATAHLWAQRGTCDRLQVGAVISHEGRLLAQGYNGTPAGMNHCAHEGDTPCDRAVHAEANAIAWSARHGVKLEGSEIHVTDMPCLECAKLIINSGIYRVVYDRPYRLETGITLLRRASLEVVSFDSITS